MIRVSLAVLTLALALTIPALIVVTTGGSFPMALVWSLWALWGIAAIGGGAVYFTARRTGRL